ncbi:MAG: hypothetical protein ACI8W7_003953, partial [Gammaproteobacteria bacterium]
EDACSGGKCIVIRSVYGLDSCVEKRQLSLRLRAPLRHNNNASCVVEQSSASAGQHTWMLLGTSAGYYRPHNDRTNDLESAVYRDDCPTPYKSLTSRAARTDE